MTDRRTGYRTLFTVPMTCELGDKHTVEVYAEKWLTPTGEKVTKDWYGYGEQTHFPADVYADHEGRRYALVAPMDYGVSSHFRSLGEHRGMVSRPPMIGVRFDRYNA